MLRSRAFLLALTFTGIAVCCAVGGMLFAFHTPLTNHVRAGWFSSEVSGKTVHHFLAAGCRCSGQLLAHLLNRDAQDGVKEYVVYFGPTLTEQDQLRKRGYDVRYESAPEDSGILAAPWLVVRERNGSIAYSGGYEPSPYWESRILFNVEHKLRQASLSTTGCVTSARLRAETFAYRMKEKVKVP